MRLRKIRQAKKISQAALAKQCGLPRASTSIRLRPGANDPPLSTLNNLARALKVSVAELLG
jgi:transcriptional regulator with XRE-family HTH domain